jgi:hypothetical protein
MFKNTSSVTRLISGDAGRAHLRHIWRVLRKKTIRGSEQVLLRLGRTLPTAHQDISEQVTGLQLESTSATGRRMRTIHRAQTHSPLPLRVATTTGKNHLKEEITPLLPTGIGERFSQTISNLGHAALLRRM